MGFACRFPGDFDSFNDRLELKGTAASLSPVLKWLRHFRGVSEYNSYAPGNNYFRTGYRSSVAEPLMNDDDLPISIVCLSSGHAEWWWQEAKMNESISTKAGGSSAVDLEG